jgi:hypothetical protein
VSVGLYQYDGDIYDRDSQLVLSESIASQQFYEKYWKRAIKERNIKYVQDGAQFDSSKESVVLEELRQLRDWAETNLNGKDLEYMKSRIENLQRIIPLSFSDKNTMLYIF